MPLFDYQVIDAGGKKRTGVIEAHDGREAKEKLREQGLMLSRLSPKKTTSARQNLRGDHLVSFTMQLSQLVSAGVPLYQSLTAIEEQYRTEPFHQVILSLCDQIKSGTSLSSAMAAYPDSFSRLYIAMISAGESSGALNIVLEKLSQLLSKQNALKKQIVTAMIYPGILASFSVLVIFLLLGFVVPSIEGIFADRQLNGFTQAVLTISHFFRDYWWAYIPAIAGMILLTVIRLRSPKGKLWLQRNLLRVPLLRTLVIQAAVARFCRTMGTLQQGGVTMIDSLRIARNVMGNVVLENDMHEAERKIVEGSSLSAELMKSKWIPHMVSRMLAVGEDAGSTRVMFNKIADMYEDDLEKSLERLMALAQPVILILMGTIIGTVMMAILIPLTDVGSLTG